MDVDKYESLAKQYGVMSIPNLSLFKNGQIVDKKIGFNIWQKRIRVAKNQKIAVIFML